MGSPSSFGKHTEFSSTAASSSSSFQSLVVSQSFSNSISRVSSPSPSPSSVSGKKQASWGGRCVCGLCTTGCTQRRSRSRLCRSRSSSMRLKISCRGRAAAGLDGSDDDSCSFSSAARRVSRVERASSTICGSRTRLLRQFSRIYRGADVCVRNGAAVLGTQGAPVSYS